MLRRGLHGVGISLVVLSSACGRRGQAPAVADSIPASGGARATDSGQVASPVPPSDSTTRFGMSLGDFLALHPTDSLLVPVPGVDQRLAIDGDYDDRVPGIWCARASRRAHSPGGDEGTWRYYFFPVPPEGPPPGPRESASALRARFCRLGLIALEVAAGDSVVGRVETFEDRLIRFPIDLLPRRRQGELWQGGPAACMDARYGFYGPRGRTVPCAAAYQLDSAIAGGRESPERGRASTFERRPHPEFLAGQMGFLDSTDRALYREIEGIEHPEVEDLPHYEAPADTALIGRMIRFRDRLHQRSVTEQAVGFALLDLMVGHALQGFRFGWPPVYRDDPKTAWIKRLGAEILRSDADFDWLYNRNFLDSAETRRAPGIVGDSLFVWTLGSSSGCGDWGGTRFRDLIERTRPYTDPSRSQGIRALALSQLAGAWADSAWQAPGPAVPALVDSMTATLDRLEPLVREASTREMVRRARWRARLGLQPISSRTTCEYAD